MRHYTTRGTILALLLTMIGSLALAESTPKPLEVLDQAKLAVRYHFEMKTQALGRELMTDTMVLLVGDHTALSYTESTLRYDSIMSTDEGDQVMMQHFREGMAKSDAMLLLDPHTLPEYIYTDRDKGEITVYESKSIYVPILYREPLDTPSWRIRDDDIRVIAGHKAYKAACDYRGRHYEAWYTDEIPCEAGPWKLHGLPGLILEVYDEDRDFFWTAIDIRTDLRPGDCPIRWLQYFDTPFTEVERKSYLRDARDFMEGGDPEENATLRQVIRSGIRSSYRQKREKPLKYDFLERDYAEEQGSDTAAAPKAAATESKDGQLTIPGTPSQDHLLVKYTYTQLKDTLTGATFTPDPQLLEIRPDTAIYYSLKTYQMRALYSSREGKKKWQGIFQREIGKLNAGGKMADFMANLPRNGDLQLIVREPEGPAMRVYDMIGGEQYYYDDSATQEWALTDSTRTILGYRCQQATTTFRGREWVVWFTYDVPVSSGPWKLHGLPGLICEAYDIQRHYHYLITGLEQKRVDLDYSILIQDKAKPMSRRKLIDSQTLYTDSGGELATLDNRPSGNDYPKPKELL